MFPYEQFSIVALLFLSINIVYRSVAFHRYLPAVSMVARDKAKFRLSNDSRVSKYLEKTEAAEAAAKSTGFVTLSWKGSRVSWNNGV